MLLNAACFCAPQISVKERLADNLLECTMQDLLRYDDYNNDGRLSLHEFYTAFRESSGPALLSACLPVFSSSSSVHPEVHR